MSSVEFSQDIGHALVGSGQRAGFRQAREGVHGMHPALDIQRAAGLAGADGLEYLDRDILLLVPGAESLDHILQHLPGAAGSNDPGRILRLGQRQALAQVQVQLFFHDDPQHRKRCPAQGKGVLGAGGRLADTEDADQRVQPVRQCQGAGSRGFRQPVPGELGPVLLNDGCRNLRRLAVIQGVVIAGDTLHVGELQHHLGEQVGLAEQRRAAGELWR